MPCERKINNNDQLYVYVYDEGHENFYEEHRLCKQQFPHKPHFLIFYNSKKQKQSKSLLRGRENKKKRKLANLTVMQH